MKLDQPIEISRKFNLLDSEGSEFDLNLAHLYTALHALAMYWQPLWYQLSLPRTIIIRCLLRLWSCGNAVALYIKFAGRTTKTRDGVRVPKSNPYCQEKVLSFPDPPSSAIVRDSSRGHPGNVGSIRLPAAIVFFVNKLQFRRGK